MLNSNDVSPLYQQLTQKMRSDIESGIYKPGEKLPTELALCESYNVSRATVRSALGQLEKEGMIVRKQGKGTFVTPKKITRNIAVNASFSDICIANGKKPGGKVLKCMIEPANNDDIRELKLSEGDSVIVLDRIRYAGDVPVSVESSRMPEEFAFLLREDMNNVSLFQVLREKYGVVFYPGHKEIELTFASHETARYLQIKTGYPLISISAVSVNASGEPIHRSTQLIVGDKFKLYL